MAKTVNERRLMNVALFHLRRFSPSQASMRRVLQRRVHRWTRDGATVEGDLEALLTRVLERLTTSGYLDDERLALAKVSSLRRAGTSARGIGLKLRRAGLASEHVSRARASEPMSDTEAVWIWARRKRLGVYRTTQRLERREKDLAALVRAGFSFRDARAVVDAKEPKLTGP